MSMGSHVRAIELQAATRLASANDRRFNEIKSENNLWHWAIQTLYVLGAGLVGFAFIRNPLHARDTAEPATRIEPFTYPEPPAVHHPRDAGGRGRTELDLDVSDHEGRAPAVTRREDGR